MIDQFRTSAATKPDGIAVMGHPGDEAFDSLINDAEKQGIIVTSQNTPLAKAQAAYQANGFGYVGAVQYTAGHDLGARSRQARRYQERRSRDGLGSIRSPTRGQRSKGAFDALTEAGADGGHAGDRYRDRTKIPPPVLQPSSVTFRRTPMSNSSSPITAH